MRRLQNLLMVAMVGLSTPAFAQTGAAPLSAADKVFLTKDAQGAAFELSVAKLAADKSSRADVKGYAQKLVGDHDAYNAALQELGRVKGVPLPTDVDAKDKAELAKLGALSGAPFDKAFLENAVRINRDDKRAADREAAATKDADIKAFIEKFAATDADHAKLAETLVKAK